jgi:SNF2 family DNA or RNA helicase
MFSPSRRKMLKTQEKPSRCVCCNRILKRPKFDEKKDGRRNDAFENLEDNDINDEDDDFIVEDDYIEYDRDGSEAEEDNGGEAENSSKTEGPNRKGEGDIVPIPLTMCRTGGKGLRHFACETCLEKLEETCSTCPRCDTLFGRLHLMSGKEELLRKKEEAKVKKEVDIKTDPEDMEIPRQVYCRHIEGGFRASAKLESIVANFEAVPKDEKVIIASFFKSSLDLLEAIFHEKDIPTCRFDGDISNEDREEELIRFKTRENCRVLLMSVQTGGTG